ncbi:MAG: acyltransferase [Ferruginibacter sp.]
MLTIVFKIIRKIKLWIHRLLHSLKMSEYQYLYKERFKVARNVTAGNDFNIYFDVSNSQLEISGNVSFRNGCELRTGQDGILSIGHNTFFNNYCSLQCFGKISIGNNCQFGESVKMYDMNHRFSDPNKLISDQGYSVGEIIIGNNCWIGSNVTILKNVTIGDNVVIGANCLIYKSVPANSLVVHNENLVITNRRD